MKDTNTFGPAASLAEHDAAAPERARQIIDQVWQNRSSNLSQGEAEWLDSTEPGDAWPLQKALAIASRDGQPVPRIPSVYLPPATA